MQNLNHWCWKSSSDSWVTSKLNNLNNPNWYTSHLILPLRILLSSFNNKIPTPFLKLGVVEENVWEQLEGSVGVFNECWVASLGPIDLELIPTDFS